VHEPIAVPGNGHAAAPAALGEAKRAASDQAEREFLERALHEAGGVVTELARRYDMNRSHVQTLLKKHGLRSRDCRNGHVPA
jgi:transcriptional regulator with GAF, ATPase, and Fis domain